MGYKTEDTTTAVPIIWRKDVDHHHFVYPGWLMADNAATVRISHSALKPGVLYYKPIYMLRVATIKEAVKSAETINAAMLLRLEASLSLIYASKAALDAAIANYKLKVAGELTAHGLGRLEKAEAKS